MTNIIKIKDLCKSFKRGQENYQILNKFNLEIQKGDLTFIVGKSGSGKSTLLQLMGGLDSPDSGEIFITENELSKMKDNELSIFRRRNLGFVFQFFNLLNNLSAVENVAMPLILDGVDWDTAKKRAIETLEYLELPDRINHYPHQLSGGQLQRIAIARSIVAKPEIIFADEPTGNLDSKNAQEVLKLFKKLSLDNNLTIVFITHDKSILEFGNRIIEISDGEIINDKRN